MRTQVNSEESRDIHLLRSEQVVGLLAAKCGIGRTIAFRALAQWGGEPARRVHRCTLWSLSVVEIIAARLFAGGWPALEKATGDKALHAESRRKAKAKTLFRSN